MSPSCLGCWQDMCSSPCSLWIAKFTVSEFLKRLTNQVWRKSYEVGLQTIRYFLVVTFIAVVIATLSECQPFSHYWQILPDPGAKCRQGVAQLITMGTSDIITDILLVCFPIPIVLKSTMAVKRSGNAILRYHRFTNGILGKFHSYYSSLSLLSS